MKYKQCLSSMPFYQFHAKEEQTGGQKVEVELVDEMGHLANEKLVNAKTFSFSSASARQ